MCTQMFNALRTALNVEGERLEYIRARTLPGTLLALDMHLRSGCVLLINCYTKLMGQEQPGWVL